MSLYKYKYLLYPSSAKRCVVHFFQGRSLNQAASLNLKRSPFKLSRTFAGGERKGEMETVNKKSFLHCMCQREMAILEANFAYWRWRRT